MNFADQTTTSAALDPTMQVLLTVFGAALVTALAGGIGALIAWSREHRRWVREKRYAAYIDALALLRRVKVLHKEVRDLEANDATFGPALKSINERAGVLLEQFPEVSAPFALLGPDKIDQALGEAAAASSKNDIEELKALEELLIRKMRATIKIKNR